jgi:hypothetical protein
MKEKREIMAKSQTQEERLLIKLIGKLPVSESDKTAWLEQIQRGDMNEELAEAIRARLSEPAEEGAANPAAANRSRYLVELANAVRRWRLSSQSHNFGGARR